MPNYQDNSAKPHLPRQNLADSGMTKIIVNPTYVPDHHCQPVAAAGLKAEYGGRRPWFGRLEFQNFHCLPGSLWADGDLAELSGQLGEMVEHTNQTQTRPGPRPPD